MHATHRQWDSVHGWLLHTEWPRNKTRTYITIIIIALSVRSLCLCVFQQKLQKGQSVRLRYTYINRSLANQGYKSVLKLINFYRFRWIKTNIKIANNRSYLRWFTPAATPQVCEVALSWVGLLLPHPSSNQTPILVPTTHLPSLISASPTAATLSC